MARDKNSVVSEGTHFSQHTLSDKVDCFNYRRTILCGKLKLLHSPRSFYFVDGYYDYDGDVNFLIINLLLSDDTTHNLASKEISDHKPEHNESSITFSPKDDPFHPESTEDSFHTLPFEDCSSNYRYLLFPVEDSDHVQDGIRLFSLIPDDLLPPGVENEIM
ncbi:hypothetical protein Tco_0851358 [Tanacetum coccineum]